MNLKDILAISGMPGLYELVKNRSNGLIVKEIASGKTKFVPARKYQFTPLNSIGIFTDDDSIELPEVFKKMKTESENQVIPDYRDNKGVIISYFEHIIPNYDRSRVYVKDMKKVLKWYSFLNNIGMIHFADEEE